MTPLDLRALVEQAPGEELPALLGRIVEAEALVRMRLMTLTMSNANGHEATPEPEKWISPEAAAAIAGVPKERIYAWSKGRKWAARPSRRCLRISEQSFRRWLAARA